MNFVRATGVQSISLFRWTTLPMSLLRNLSSRLKLRLLEYCTSTWRSVKTFHFPNVSASGKMSKDPQMQWPRSSLSPNAGSSSLKLALFTKNGTNQPGADASGQLEGIGIQPRFTVKDAAGVTASTNENLMIAATRLIR